VKRTCKICRVRFVPEFDRYPKGYIVKQLVCSCRCMVHYYEKQKPKGRTLAKECANQVGRRSMGEVKFDAEYLEGTPISYKYEPEKFKYLVHKTCTYTPDFKIQRKSNRKPLYIEYKGVLDVATRNKMKLVKLQHPLVDIRFVFQDASNKIRKGSKTTYGQWADQWGFRWADGELPKLWLK
jgi:hypothetical protein